MTKTKPMPGNLLQDNPMANFMSDATGRHNGQSSRHDERVRLYQRVYASALTGAATLLDGTDAEVSKQARQMCRRAAILAAAAIDDDEMMWYPETTWRFFPYNQMGIPHTPLTTAEIEHMDKNDGKDDRLEGGQRRHEQGSQPISKPLTSDPLGKPPESKPLHKPPEGEPFQK